MIKLLVVTLLVAVGFGIYKLYKQSHPTVPAVLPVQLVSGYQVAGFGSSLAGSNASGLANDATVYTTTIKVDGVTFPISIIGSAAQTVTLVMAAFNTQLEGMAKAVIYGGNLLVTSTSFGATSTVLMVTGTLFPALTGFVCITGTIGGKK
jgi:hypothetical protein